MGDERKCIGHKLLNIKRALNRNWINYDKSLSLCLFVSLWTNVCTSWFQLFLYVFRILPRNPLHWKILHPWSKNEFFFPQIFPFWNWYKGFYRCARFTSVYTFLFIFFDISYFTNTIWPINDKVNTERMNAANEMINIYFNICNKSICLLIRLLTFWNGSLLA